MALSLLALSKDQTCGSKSVGAFKRPDLWLLSPLALSKDQTCGSKPAGIFKIPDFALSLLALSKD